MVILNLDLVGNLDHIYKSRNFMVILNLEFYQALDRSTKVEILW